MVLLVGVAVAVWLAVLVFAVVLCRAAALGDEADPAIGRPAVRREGALRLARRPIEDDSRAALEDRGSSPPSSQEVDALRDVTSTRHCVAEGAGDRRARARRR